MIPGSANPLLLKSAAAAGAYQVSRSLRFNSSDSGFCSRTFGTATSRRTWTWAGWVKRAKLSEYVRLFNNTASGNAAIQFMDSDKLRFFDTGISLDIQTTQVFRDASAWYHFVIVLDTVQGTSSDRAKIYVNGVQITTFSTSTYPSQNADGGINNNNAHQIGSLGGSSEFFNGYLADIHFIDGQALTPSSFTEVSATTGQLIPKAYGGTFGTNGFWLKFSDNSAATAATLGKDYSGNSNNWTPNNLSVTAGAGNDSLVDTPTSFGTDTYVGGEVRGNYATLNAIAPAKNNSGTLSNGNLDNSNSSASNYFMYASTIAFDSGTSAGYYFEVTQSTYGQFSFVGIYDADTWNKVDAADNPFGAGGNVNGVSYRNNGQVFSYNSTTSGLTTWTSNGDIIGVAVKDNKVWFSKNGTWISGNPASGTSPSATIASSRQILFGSGLFGSGSAFVHNFGQRAFAYTAPSGFKALCDTNLPSPVVAKPNTVMDVVLYTGTGAALTPTSSLGFNPDWIWIKSRSAATDHALYDVVRGAQARLESNTSDAEVTTDGGVTAFNSAGFTLGTLAQVNTSSATYAAWCWDAGTSTVSNTAGSITSQVRANVSAGFSVITYTGNGGSNVSVGHGLGVAPVLLIVKSRSTSGDWDVTYTFGDGSYDFMSLNTTAAKLDITGRNAPTSTLFYVNGGLSNVNATTYVCYAFSPVVGYSSMGSYVGNGTNDGPFVYTGFRPRWMLIKKSSSAGPWTIIDSSRLGYNPNNYQLYSNDPIFEYSGAFVYNDLLSNGFKPRTIGDEFNASGATYIYYAVAENPFQYARAR